MLAGCNRQPVDSVTASSEEASQPVHMPLAIDPALTTSVDQQLLALQKKLPQKHKQIMFNAAVRHNQTIYYSYTMLDSKRNRDNFNVESVKKDLQQSCRQPLTRRMLLGGFDFVYVYTFQDHSQVSVLLSGKDCR
ncbi:hypothetical protein BGI36_03695 [Snodgrassella communis]|uniref:Uncharacterized protein n=1 Tax=Snodgrassella alvi TaxID=1196083 RepID=A0A855G1D4_9NEIS|nr:hypothetical protein BGI30_04450 [Snodgrassella alvi]PIT22359.1 hypothetical protein BGI36_03695 [Snodgrassella communis]PIT51002.1 hypothetical protein BHC51_00810 [Snodgrassella alvi]PIT55353.1 hypothetical protein BHC59_10865 [Snodgrassella alvi]PIT60589.1 hypothetical protein BHC57_03800 [Snodgrassella alvi]